MFLGGLKSPVGPKYFLRSESALEAIYSIFLFGSNRTSVKLKRAIFLNLYFLISNPKGSPIPAPAYSHCGKRISVISPYWSTRPPVLREPRHFLLFDLVYLLILKDRTTLECYNNAAITIGNGLSIVLLIANNRQQ